MVMQYSNGFAFLLIKFFEFKKIVKWLYASLSEFKFNDVLSLNGNVNIMRVILRLLIHCKYFVRFRAYILFKWWMDHGQKISDGIILFLVFIEKNSFFALHSIFPNIFFLEKEFSHAKSNKVERLSSNAWN